MKLRQLHYFHEVIKQDFNVSAAAKALYTSQPGISRQLQELADELGVDLFRYQGKRLIGLTEPGREIAAIADKVLQDVARIRQVADAHAVGQRGGLVVVATRHAAEHRLHDAMIRFRERMPALPVRISEEDPVTASTMLRTGDAHVGVLSEPPERHPDLVYFPIEQWRLLLVVPQDHDLCRQRDITLELLAGCTICSYERRATSRHVIDEAFRRRELEPAIPFALGSSATILQYVESGAGIGIIGESAFDPASYPTLKGLDVKHLFRPLTTDIVLLRKATPPTHVYEFMRILDPSLTQTLIEEAKKGPGPLDKRSGSPVGK